MAGINTSFLWPLADDWYLSGHSGVRAAVYDAMPHLVLFKAAGGSIHKCTESYTPWDEDFASKLQEVFAETERQRLAKDAA